MTAKRKTWFIVWAIVIILFGIATGGFGAIFPLVILGFIELIHLFVFSVKRGKQKMMEVNEQIKKEQEQRNIGSWNVPEQSIEEKESVKEYNETTEALKSAGKTAGKKLLATAIAASPLRLITDPLLKVATGKNTEEFASSSFGVENKHSKKQGDKKSHIVQKQSTIKWCGTCENWSGRRKVTNASRIWAEFDEYEECICYKATGGGHPKKKGNDRCTKWQKWGGLK